MVIGGTNYAEALLIRRKDSRGACERSKRYSHGARLSLHKLVNGLIRGTGHRMMYVHRGGVTPVTGGIRAKRQLCMGYTTGFYGKNSPRGGTNCTEALSTGWEDSKCECGRFKRYSHGPRPLLYKLVGS
ncbi:hypothetical protein PanWU01x14_000620 [Parasponia andersonii]|uniref:Uncharacterized protein n=1 Tax=Parasponia andersonii TaxID=3476 RepID=A0A2P5E4P2_PARAD|nr:hypothetical protein PanWU01x14_000620 [Parasponia andersonii]